MRFGQNDTTAFLTKRERERIGSYCAYLERAGRYWLRSRGCFGFVSPPHVYDALPCKPHSTSCYALAQRLRAHGAACLSTFLGTIAVRDRTCPVCFKVRPSAGSTRSRMRSTIGGDCRETEGACFPTFEEGDGILMPLPNFF